DGAPPAARTHGEQYGLGTQKCGFEVDGDRAVELGLVELVQSSDAPRPGVVDQNVDGAELVLDALAVVHGHIGAGFSQRKGDGPSDTARSAGHKSNPSGQVCAWLCHGDTA